MIAPPGVILAGGLSRRMERGEKSLALLGGRPLVAHVIHRLAPQCEDLAINANGPPARFARFGLPVLPDPVPDRPGPLAGILAAMHWAAERGDDRVLTVSADAPFLPGDLVPKLLLALEETGPRPALAQSGGRVHPVCALWPVALRDRLADTLAAGTRKVRDWTDTVAATAADFPATDPDPFFNVNTPDDLARAERYLTAGQPPV
ncbi:molybdopterin-guanine dinucleotide biosynthesis protein A [Pseudooceanicola batsensis HTCC2597]|uniref:Molybdenum cofactor guanylyltransferase n=1 Tax=Pseudooceanicola batsensis (strain ATCC BAA-863 / DSM 15984 / KCTC 12145 / HTCC2597) TaxID=252305 RepID=A3TVA3_PSEBH|nr:molybdopterin-guanine dinucleotide biosynthesis protein A [Pseudooceanicola batsensis HTCC2597]